MQLVNFYPLTTADGVFFFLIREQRVFGTEIDAHLKHKNKRTEGGCIWDIPRQLVQGLTIFDSTLLI